MPSRESQKNVARQPSFDLIAGHVSLDFVNTLDDRYAKQSQELLEHYDDLVRFGDDTGMLDPGQARLLMKLSSQDPDLARESLHRARALREAIHDVFFAIMSQREVPAAPLARLNLYAQRAAEHLRLVPANGGFEWRFEDVNHLDGLLWRIARSAADLLVSDKLPFVRACSSATCRWFFLDTSKNHQRRWCDMKRCGNRAKVRRFYANKSRRHEDGAALTKSRKIIAKGNHGGH